MNQWTLPTIARELREAPGWSRGERVTRMLLKEPDLRLLLVGLPAGARWPQHRSASRAIVTVIDGRLDFTAEGSTHTVTPGGVIAVPPSVPHDVHAHEDSFFLLAIAGPGEPVQMGS